jgi:hypothetical protein
LLGLIHQRAHFRSNELRTKFSDRTFFRTLRLEPYYEYSATVMPSAKPFLTASLVANGKPTLPQLTVNLFSGGKHAFGQVAIQDVLVVPLATATIADSLAIVYEIYQSAAELISRKYNSRCNGAHNFEIVHNALVPGFLLPPK